MPINASHEGYDQVGAPTTHKGLLETCPAPECQDRLIEQQEDWGTYCPHGQKIVERDPDRTDPEGYPVGRIVSPWPCNADGCTPEAFEAAEQAIEDEYWESLLNEVPR